MSGMDWTREELNDLHDLLAKGEIDRAKDYLRAQPTEKQRAVLGAAINNDNTGLAEKLATHLSRTLLFDVGIVAASPSKPETLEWAKNAPGFDIVSVDPACPKSVLIKAAQLHLSPAATCVEGAPISGGEFIGNSYDAEVIEAFLSSGHRDGFNPEAAASSGRQDIVNLYRKHKLEKKADVIKCGISYMDNQGNIVVPEGIRCIGNGAFAHICSLRSISLPESLEEIGDSAFWFSRGTIDCIVLPRNLKKLGRYPLPPAESIELLDTQELTGRSIVNLLPKREFIVRSEASGKIKYKVWLNNSNIGYKDMPLLESAWKKGEGFDMGVLDQLYTKYRSEKGNPYNDKLISAINRLRWPIELDEAMAKKYRTYVKRNAIEAVGYLAKHDDDDRFSVIFDCGGITTENHKEALEVARSTGARKIAELISKAEKATEKSSANKLSLTKPSTAQLVTLVADGLDAGDASKLAILEPITAKVSLADCTELLERAAANCNGETIDRLYTMFAPFECESSALHIALFSGNIETSKALLAHGANLDCKMRELGEKRAPSSKKSAREKRYSHGLIGKSYSAGKTVARNLSEALTKYNGNLTSRTKTTGRFSLLGNNGHAYVNRPSRDKAADTLLAICNEDGFEKSIAIRLLWNFISFDGRQTIDAAFDTKNAQKLFDAGILTAEDILGLPWEQAIKSGLSGNENPMDIIQFIEKYGSRKLLIKCWRERFAEPNPWCQELAYDNVEMLLFFINLDDDTWDPGNKPDILNCLTRTGKLDALKKLSNRPGWFTKQRVSKLLDIANECNRVAITAWLLELSQDM